MTRAAFEWDDERDRENQLKHGVGFAKAQFAFADPHRVIALDTSHSADEERYFCFGATGGGILTVRFSYRSGAIRIFGAGYWRKGRRIYERENQIHR
ncbi:MAG TPA: BrnT family toxin [Casimicrobiaceae bacterium]|nr:BrnT family toxin [Casimicrobiaceae bacterium]